MQLKQTCDPKEVALKSFFLGPQAENADWLKTLFVELLEQWVQWRRSLYPSDGVAITPQNQASPNFLERKQSIQNAAHELLTRFEQEVPKFSPRYVGHMFSEISLPALLGHVITLLHNPNNISGEASRVGVQIENEAIQELVQMIGYNQTHSMGHFTSGGTIANLEALVRAHSRFSEWLASSACVAVNGSNDSFDFFRSAHCGWKVHQDQLKQLQSQNKLHEVNQWSISNSNPYRVSRNFAQLTTIPFSGPIILIPQNKHYSWVKGCHLLGLGSEGLWPIELDQFGRLDTHHLKTLIEKAKREHRPILLVVSVLGTTELGGMDPAHRVQTLLDEEQQKNGIHIWHHIDAAYGGFFKTIGHSSSPSLSIESRDALEAIERANSVTLDPHKLGYVPYSSGAFLTREKMDYYFSMFEDAPYLDFKPSTDRGPYTLEGSRSAAGAVATWLSAKTMGFNSEGYGLLLDRTVRIKQKLSDILAPSVQIAPGCDTNVLCFHLAQAGESLSVSNARTLKVAEYFSTQNKNEFTVSKTRLRFKHYGAYLNSWLNTWASKPDAEEVILIRMCLMNPFFGSIETSTPFMQEFTRVLKSIV